jgi:hypothetical protein
MFGSVASGSRAAGIVLLVPACSSPGDDGRAPQRHCALYRSKAKFGGLDESDARRPKAPEDGNAKQEAR